MQDHQIIQMHRDILRELRRIADALEKLANPPLITGPYRGPVVEPQPIPDWQPPTTFPTGDPPYKVTRTGDPIPARPENYC